MPSRRMGIVVVFRCFRRPNLLHFEGRNWILGSFSMFQPLFGSTSPSEKGKKEVFSVRVLGSADLWEGFEFRMRRAISGSTAECGR